MNAGYESDYYPTAPRTTQDWIDGCAAGYTRGIKGEEDISYLYVDSDNESERMFGQGLAYGYPEGAMMAEKIASFGIPFPD